MAENLRHNYVILTREGQSTKIMGGLVTHMRIVPLGSGGKILDLDWFLKYRDTKLVIQTSKIEGKDDLLAY